MKRSFSLLSFISKGVNGGQDMANEDDKVGFPRLGIRLLACRLATNHGLTVLRVLIVAERDDTHSKKPSTL
jgi:hypothetical protein